MILVLNSSVVLMLVVALQALRPQRKCRRLVFPLKDTHPVTLNYLWPVALAEECFHKNGFQGAEKPCG